jgi:FSR family fosmidomycin resistance protein-like MFS transporter
MEGPVAKSLPAMSHALTLQPAAQTPARRTAGTAVAVLVAVSFGHLLNDMLQSLLPAIYPVLKGKFSLGFGEIGVITLVFQLTASVLQPVIGVFTDRRPMPYSLPVGMGFTLLGLLLLSVSGSYAELLVAVALIGIGSSVFHPESSRVARMASGGKHGMAQSLFQVGGNAGSALGPLLAAFIVAPQGLRVDGQGRVAWFGLAALLGIAVLGYVGRWYAGHARITAPNHAAPAAVSGRRVGLIIGLLVGLMTSKFIYMASMGNYYIFYLMAQFHVSAHTAQLCLFVFLGAVAAGTFAGGPIGDRIGRRRVILVSIVGVLPFTLALPHLGFAWTVLMTLPIGLLLASAFPAIVVYAQETMPHRIGMISGLFFGLAFGVGGLAAALLGVLADRTSIQLVYQICAFLPAMGLLALLLPEEK